MSEIMVISIKWNIIQKLNWTSKRRANDIEQFIIYCKVERSVLFLLHHKTREYALLVPCARPWHSCHIGYSAA